MWPRKTHKACLQIYKNEHVSRVDYFYLINQLNLTSRPYLFRQIEPNWSSTKIHPDHVQGRLVDSSYFQESKTTNKYIYWHLCLCMIDCHAFYDTVIYTRWLGQFIYQRLFSSSVSASELTDIYNITENGLTKVSCQKYTIGFSGLVYYNQ